MELWWSRVYSYSTFPKTGCAHTAFCLSIIYHSRGWSELLPQYAQHLRAPTLGGHVTLSIIMDVLLFVAVDCKVSLLGITGQSSHLGSFAFPPGLDTGKWNWKYPRLLAWAWFSGFFYVKWESPIQKGVFKKWIQILHPFESCAVLSLSCYESASCMHRMQFQWHLTTSLTDSVCCCSIYRCACKPPSENHYCLCISISQHWEIWLSFSE